MDWTIGTWLVRVSEPTGLERSIRILRCVPRGRGGCVASGHALGCLFVLRRVMSARARNSWKDMSKAPSKRDALEAFLADEEQSVKNPEAHFTLSEKLGEGSYGNVFRGVHKGSDHDVAVKVIPVQGDWEELKKEIKILRQCKSDFVVQYYGSYMTQDDDMWIVMEYCSAGSVSDLMESTCRTLTEEQFQHITASVLLGLSYLHGMKLIHRDIKSGNILLTARGQAKLADFGVSAQMNTTVSKRQTVIGTPFWMAPEVIQEVRYDGKADIWSLGITVIEMAEGNPPLSDIHPMRAIFMIPANPPPTMTDKSQWHVLTNDFLSQCLRKDLNQRPEARILCGHPFVSRVVAQLKKNEGCSPVLAELVRGAMDAIRETRSSATLAAAEAAVEMNESTNASGTMVEVGNSNATGTMVQVGGSNSSGTMIAYNSGTMVEVGSNDSGTMIVREEEASFANASGTMLVAKKEDTFRKGDDVKAEIAELKAALAAETKRFLSVKAEHEAKVDQINARISQLTSSLSR